MSWATFLNGAACICFVRIVLECLCAMYKGPGLQSSCSLCCLLCFTFIQFVIVFKCMVCIHTCHGAGSYILIKSWCQGFNAILD